jgi:hypothetical protein
MARARNDDPTTHGGEFRKHLDGEKAMKALPIGIAVGAVMVGCLMGQTKPVPHGDQTQWSTTIVVDDAGFGLPSPGWQGVEQQAAADFVKAFQGDRSCNGLTLWVYSRHQDPEFPKDSSGIVPLFPTDPYYWVLAIDLKVPPESYGVNSATTYESNHRRFDWEITLASQSDSDVGIPLNRLGENPLFWELTKSGSVSTELYPGNDSDPNCKCASMVPSLWSNQNSGAEAASRVCALLKSPKPKNSDQVPMVTLSHTELATMCGEDSYGLLNLPENRELKAICDNWQAEQPRTKVERLPFHSLVRRLLLETAPSTDFARYRGMQLKSDGATTTYDAIVLPTDVLDDLACTVKQEDRQEGVMYTYECFGHTSSFAASVQLRDKLVQSVSDLHLVEDEVREHGLSAHARSEGMCAPNGDCSFQHEYASALTDGKLLQIDANPSLARTLSAIAQAKRDGSRAPISGSDPKEGVFSFSIFSFGPPKK